MASLVWAFCNLRLARLATPQSQQEFVECCLVFIHFSSEAMSAQLLFHVLASYARSLSPSMLESWGISEKRKDLRPAEQDETENDLGVSFYVQNIFREVLQLSRELDGSGCWIAAWVLWRLYRVVPEEKFLWLAHGCMFDSCFKLFWMFLPACTDLCSSFPLTHYLSQGDGLLDENSTELNGETTEKAVWGPFA